MITGNRTRVLTRERATATTSVLLHDLRPSTISLSITGQLAIYRGPGTLLVSSQKGVFLNPGTLLERAWWSWRNLQAMVRRKLSALWRAWRRRRRRQFQSEMPYVLGAYFLACNLGHSRLLLPRKGHVYFWLDCIIVAHFSCSSGVLYWIEIWLVRLLWRKMLVCLMPFTAHLFSLEKKANSYLGNEKEYTIKTYSRKNMSNLLRILCHNMIRKKRSKVVKKVEVLRFNNLEIEWSRESMSCRSGRKYPVVSLCQFQGASNLNSKG
jgi:hypothetical protein